MKPLNTAHFDAFVLIFYIFRKKELSYKQELSILGQWPHLIVDQ